MRFRRLLGAAAMIGVAAAAETPSPALLVLNKADQALAIIDPASGKVVARVSVGAGPHEVTVSPMASLLMSAITGNRCRAIRFR
jgi:YVTN family beta-propeller protein